MRGSRIGVAGQAQKPKEGLNVEHLTFTGNGHLLLFSAARISAQGNGAFQTCGT